MSLLEANGRIYEKFHVKYGLDEEAGRNELLVSDNGYFVHFFNPGTARRRSVARFGWYRIPKCGKIYQKFVKFTKK
jgi:hypothetical protein